MTSDNITNILHIEDNLSDAYLLKKYLSAKNAANNNYEITHSPTLASALNNLNKVNSYNAILLDINLPDGNGIQNIEAIKKINSDIPIVVITSAQDEKTAEEALRLGAQECITKSYGNAHVIQRAIQSSILRKKTEIELARKAYFDDLTGLPNRVSFENAAQTMIRHAQRWERRDALMFLDLNKFKQINDTHGHEVGNIVLKELAQRLRDTLRSSDLIARYAGDEFVVYLDCGKAPVTEDLCAYLAEKINKAAEKPIKFGTQSLEISLSIGAAIYPDAGHSFDALLKNADLAMYEAKNNPEIKYRIIGGEKSKKENNPQKTKSSLKINKGPNSILIIEDEEMDRALYKNILVKSDTKFTITEASTIHDAFSILEKISPSCILLDQNLPDSSGIEFLEKYKKSSYSKDVPIIMITGQHDRKLAVQALRRGIKDFIVKDEIDHDRFIQTVENSIEKFELKEQLKNYQKELERSNKDLSDFSHTVAHDLKAPMRKIMMFCDVLSKEEDVQLNEKLQSYIGRMDISAHRMQNLIESLLNYAQISYDDEKKENIPLENIYDEIVEDLDIWLQENNAQITHDFMPSCPIYKTIVKQLITNLITNSVKYKHPERAPKIHINSLKKDGKYSLLIADNGRGIPEKQIHKIFKPFHRLQSADEIEGSGLGLSICEKIMRKHGGHISVESVEGQGSIFHAVFPDIDQAI